MSGTWAADWATNDVVTAAEFRKSLGCVADSTLGASAASIDFTGLPTTYAHLLVMLEARGDTAATVTGLSMRLNNDSGANYGTEQLSGTAAVASAAETVSATSATVGSIAAASATAGHVGTSMILLPNYAGTSLFKGFISLGGVTTAITTGAMFVQPRAGIWISTAAINRITLLPAAGNFIAGTRASIYVMGS